MEEGHDERSVLHMKKALVLVLVLSMLMTVSVALADTITDNEVASSTYGWVVAPVAADENGCVTVEIMEVPNFEHKIYTSLPLDHKSELTQTSRADALTALMRMDNFVEVLFNENGDVIDFEIVEQNYVGGIRYQDKPCVYYFDSAKYGGELTAPGGGPGRMVAQGWVLGNDAAASTITIGDGNHVTNVFEQTYTIADDAKIFLVDNGYTVQGTGIWGTWNGQEATQESIVACPVGADGEIYYQRAKYNALCIFDGDYTTYDTAKVSELYLFRNPLILNENQLITPDDIAYDGCGWYPEVSATKEMHQYGFDGSVTPFEVMANRLYSVGDSYTCMYLLVGDNGDTAMIDQGNTCATYQYWLNVEKMGYDPRQLDAILLTHGHGDHYQAAYENTCMNNRYHVGLGDIKRGEQYLQIQTSTQNNTGYDYLGYPELTPELSDNSIRYLLTKWDVWYEWEDFGGGISVYPFLTVGHSKDTASFALIAEATEADQVFKAGEKIGFIYMGGYGAKNNLNVGYQRLAYVDGLKYLQSVIGPYVESMTDKIYNMPQHSNQYPWYEVAKAARAVGVHPMSVMTEGLDNVQNFCEKRISYNTYEKFYEQWLNKTDAFGNMLEEHAGFRCAISSKNLQTIEKYGPYKRPAGTYEMEVESALILHGFDAWQNANEAFKGLTNVYGFDLSQGLPIHKDSFVNDPDSYFVQIVCHVKDDYAGKVDYETNFYGAENYATQWTSGPVEIVNRPDAENWTEIVRTQRVGSLEEAQALLDAIQAGKTYQVNLDVISDIVLAATPAETFVEVQ